MKIHKQNHLAGAVSAALMLFVGAHSVQAATLVARDGQTLTRTGETFEGTAAEPFAMEAIEGGHLIANDVHARADQEDGAALRAIYNFATIDFKSGTIGGAVGVRAEDGGIVNLTDAVVDVTRNGIDTSSATEVYPHSTVTVKRGSITTQGYNGVVAGNGSSVRLTDTRVSNTGADALDEAIQRSGIVAEAGGIIVVEDSEITTLGDGVTGALVKGFDAMSAIPDEGLIRKSGLLEIKDSSITTQGITADAMRASADTLGSTANVTSILAQGVAATTYGHASRALVVEAGNVAHIKDSIFTTHGGSSHGVELSDRAGAVLLNTSVETTGNLAFGLTAVDRSTISLKQGKVHTSGNSSYGAIGGDVTSTISLDDTSVHTEGANAHAMLAMNGAMILALDSRISAEGADASAGSINGGGTFVLEGSTVSAVNAPTFSIQDGDVYAAQGSHLSSGTGVLAEITRVRAASTISLEGGSAALGDIVRSAFSDSVESAAVVKLDSGSSWRGASTILDAVSLAGDSRWDISNDSRARSLSVIDSLISFDDADGRFKTLTVEGDLTVDNALLAMNVALGDDSSAGDKLHVMGNTQGSAKIAVNNLGGQGADTDAGIQLVQVDGISAASFQLAGRAVAGAYDYTLHQGGLTAPNDGNWYLRTERELPPTTEEPGGPDLPVVTEPEIPTGPETPVVTNPVLPLEPEVPVSETVTPVPQPARTPVLRPEAGVYLANQAAATSLFDLRMHDRLGEPGMTSSQAKGATDGAAWIRARAERADVDIGDQLRSRTRQNVIFAGTDIGRWSDSGKGIAGVMIGTGEANSRVTSRETGYRADGRVKGTSVGAYGSWIQSPDDAEGLYVDGWAQAGRFKSRVQGDGLVAERYKSRVRSASVETGYAFILASNDSRSIYLQPQVQLTWSAYDMRGGEHQEGNGTVVRTESAGGLRSRVGARVFGNVAHQGAQLVQPYLSVNWLHQGGASNRIAMDGVVLSGASPGNTIEAKGGAQVQLRPGLTAWGELDVARGGDGYRNVGGTFAVRYGW